MPSSYGIGSRTTIKLTPAVCIEELLRQILSSTQDTAFISAQMRLYFKPLNLSV